MTLSDDFFEPFDPRDRPQAEQPRPEQPQLEQPQPEQPQPEQSQQPDEPAPRIGPNELGRIEVSSRAVEKIAAVASLEVEHAGGTSGRGIGLPGRRRSDVGRIPKVSADIDGQHVFLDVELSVRWPASIAAVSTAVRERLIDHVSSLVGLEVSEVNIEVVDLVTEAAAARVS